MLHYFYIIFLYLYFFPYTSLFNFQADVKIPGLPLKVVMEAIQQATSELKWQ